MDYEIYQLTEVVGYGTSNEEKQEFFPFYALHDLASAEDMSSFMLTTKAPVGTSLENMDRMMQEIERVVLSPRVTITADSDPEVADAVHAQVPDLCYISRSVNFPVEHDPETIRET